MYLTVLNTILGTDYTSIREAKKDLIKQGYIEDIQSKEVYLKDIEFRLTGNESQLEYYDILTKAKFMLYENLPKTKDTETLRKRLLSNGAFGTIIIINDILETASSLFYSEKPMEDTELDDLLLRCSTVKEYNKNVVLTDKALTLVDNVDFDNLKEALNPSIINFKETGDKAVALIYSLITKLVATHSKETIESTELTDDDKTKLLNLIN